MKQVALPLEYKSKIKWPDNYYRWADIPMVDSNLWKRYKEFGFDIETTGLDCFDPNQRVLSIAVAIGSEENRKAFCFYLDESNLTRQYLEDVRKLVENPYIILCGHNIKFDLRWLAVKYGWNIQCLAYDGMLAAYFLNEEDSFIGLDQLVSRFPDLGSKFGNWKSEISRGGLEYENPLDVMAYNMKDADIQLSIKQMIQPSLKNRGLDKMMNLACQAIPVLTRMESNGVTADQDYANQQQIKLFESMIGKRIHLKELAGRPFSPDSPEQLSKVLFNYFEFSPINFTKTNNPSSDHESLIKIRSGQCKTYKQIDEWDCDNPEWEYNKTKFLDTIIEYKKQSHDNNNYYEKLAEWVKYDGKVHTNYNLCTTTSGRLTSTKPTMHNIKRGSEMRGIFTPSPGYSFLEGDYSQVELRFLAFLANEKRMLKMFEDGLDIHTAVMCEMKGWDYREYKGILDNIHHKSHLEVKNLRVGIKNVNFGEVYGATAERLQRELAKHGIYWTIEQCESLMKQRQEMFPTIGRWKHSIEEFAIQHGYVRNPFGQIRRLPIASRRDGPGRKQLRQAVNFIIQSIASGWLTICTLILIDEYFQNNSDIGRALLTTHDSITSEIRKRKSIYMDQVKQDIKLIAEQDVKIFVENHFKFSLNFPLEFELKYMERWQ